MSCSDKVVASAVLSWYRLQEFDELGMTHTHCDRSQTFGFMKGPYDPVYEFDYFDSGNSINLTKT